MIDLGSKRVLVTGAGGFIGSHLAERLVQSGSNVTALIEYNSTGSYGWLNNSEYKNDMNFLLGDIRDPWFCQQATKSVDIVFHLAALIAIPYSYVAPASYVRTNIEGTLNILEASRNSNVQRIVHTSTSEVYGSAQFIPINEDHPLQGQSPYSASKIGADKIAESYFKSFELPVTTLRPFNTFGPRQSDRAVIPTIISQCLADKNIKLGNLTPTRDFTFIDDTVNGFISIANCDKAIGRTVNLGTGLEISISDLASLICKLVGVPELIQNDSERLRPDKSEVDRLLSDNSLAKSLMNWAPQVSLEEGLLNTIDWVRNNSEIFHPNKYVI
ncbi:MAG: GDP-mannose 4,6-dehydratase [Methylocystaceae bacterium]|nr:GDP-mannose 4,6-dehydratase [Methylocystaceae bacterium]